MEFEQTNYSVYARADENNKVIKVFSTCFEQPQDTDIFLRSGHGDEFVHVQGQYQLVNDDSTHKYCIDNGVMRECTEEELEEERASFPIPEPSEEELQWQAITDLEIAQMEYGQALTDLEIGVLNNEQNQ